MMMMITRPLGYMWYWHITSAEVAQNVYAGSHCVCVFKLRSFQFWPGPRYWEGAGAALTFAWFLLNGVPETASYYANVYGDFARVWIAGVPTYLITRSVHWNRSQVLILIRYFVCFAVVFVSATHCSVYARFISPIVKYSRDEKNVKTDPKTSYFVLKLGQHLEFKYSHSAANVNVTYAEIL